eukprot:SM000006S19395  [mRNA]  locus=s6:507359:509982:+ [translate_table: standard]
MHRVLAGAALGGTAGGLLDPQGRPMHLVKRQRSSGRPARWSVAAPPAPVGVRCARHGGILRRAAVRKAGSGTRPRRDPRKQEAEEGPTGEQRRRAGGRLPAADAEKEGEEDVYTLEHGWLVDPTMLTSREKTIGTGLHIPLKIRKQLEKEAESKSTSDLRGEAPPLRSTHRQLRVMGGRQGGRKLLSPADANVRPMMEVVRGAVFSMLQCLAGSPGCLPGGRWLDLYSGTGSVGIEAMSRGCATAHFVEMDPWVVSNVLGTNLSSCDLAGQSVIHTVRVEAFLKRAEECGAAFAGGIFDYVSVTPPYEAVSYSELLTKLAISPLIGSDTICVIEYPSRSKADILDQCGPLHLIRDRRYGRTNVAFYGPEWAKPS